MTINDYIARGVDHALQLFDRTLKRQQNMTENGITRIKNRDIKVDLFE